MLPPFRVFVIGLNFLPKNYEDVYDLSQKNRARLIQKIGACPPFFGGKLIL